MKTAILTFQDAENYGAALQAFALKRICEEYSDVEILNYYNDYFHRDTSGMGIKALLKRILNGRCSAQKTERYYDFQKKYLTGAMEPIKKEKLKELDGQYDYFITGSDQVWNLDCSGNDLSYFLDFVKISKKVSYAASFGTSSYKADIIKRWLSDYFKISVREKTGMDIINKTLGKEVPVVLDPTLLLDKNEWTKIFDLDFAENYVLIYEVLTGKYLFEQAKAFAVKHGLKLICITSTNKVRIGGQIIRNAGPIEWLRLFAGASYIFTNSFHGLAFSINFNKQFFVELLPPPAQTNTRIIELLEKTNLLCRDSSKANELDEIQYEIINTVVEKERQNSINYLRSIFMR